MTNESKSSRRQFLGNTAALGALGAIGVSGIIQSCSTGGKWEAIPLPDLPDVAPDGEALKLGVIGTGGRGTGAAMNFLNAGPNLSINAIADLFQDRIDKFRGELKEKKDVDIADANCFVGFDAYKQLLETDVDVVILSTPPYFRPDHFQASVEARKHVFLEKPVAVDPVGARSVMATSKQAEAAGLCVVTGTQRRHAPDYTDIYTRVQAGAIGDLVSANAYWNQAKLWHTNSKPAWTEMEYMIRDWVNWIWLSGDQTVEQHIHNTDVISWFKGKHPVKAIGNGSRHRRLTGDCYDNFSIDYIYDDRVHMNSMCRQINDCKNYVGEYLRGSEGFTDCKTTIWNPDETVKYEHPVKLNEDGEEIAKNPFDQEHVDLVTAIRTGKQVVQAEETAKSTLTAIMGREAAYTGMEVTWEEMMASDMKLGPKEMKLGPVDINKLTPVPGSQPDINQKARTY